MKTNRFYIFIFITIFLSCSTQPLKIDVEKSGDLDKLEKFFKRSESDSVKAGNVLQKHNVIQHLTHLWKMDRGGKKYYLLEKDDISEMIRSVTEGIYLGYILINKNGDIIFTTRNDEFFGVSINNGHDLTPLQKCFSNRTGVFFSDVSYLAPSSNSYSLYISSPVYVEGNFHGVLILQVDINKISEILEKGTEIISRDGIVRVTSDAQRVFTKYPVIENINMTEIDSKGEVLIKISEKKIKVNKFSYKEINWLVVH